ncbi:methyltransferase domain-containing protein [Candidatus Gracilibacteria bacterium]|nr:methyltransferase domain-containing protein [Candidatus Gracilibacteria bacterium]
MARQLLNILVNELHDAQLRRYAAEYARGQLVDIGCGIKPYQAMFAPFVTSHVGVDHRETLHTHEQIDLYGTAYTISVADNSFDTALCTAVLEHLEEPEAALRECHRVLQPGGVALYSVPFIWHLHEEPRDFFRYSKHGLRYLFEKTGFELLEIQPLSGFWVTFGQLLVYYLYRFNHGPLRWSKVITLGGVVIQALAFVLDQLDKAEQWTWMYMVVARKPACR